jgi:putative endonuclease
VDHGSNHYGVIERQAELKQFYVYIMCSDTGVLYIGITNDLVRRVYEHKNKLIEGFTADYNVTRLVYFEVTSDVRSAIEREKQLKNWRREKKVALVESVNPGWKDLGLEILAG